MGGRESGVERSATRGGSGVIDTGSLDKDLLDFLSDWVAKNGGGMVRSASLVVDLLDSDGDEGWITSELPGQSLLITAGLSSLLTESVRVHLNATLGTAGRDEDE